MKNQYWFWILIVAFPSEHFAQDLRKEGKLRTDSSIIYTRVNYWKSPQTISLYNELKNDNLVYLTEIEADSERILYTGTFRSHADNRVGRWTYYNERGKIEKIDNYKNGTTSTYLDGDTVTGFFNAVIAKGDSFLIAHLGKDFVEQYITFNANESDWNTGSHRWFENRGHYGAHNFFLSYNIGFGDDQHYPTIEFWIDSTGFGAIRGFTACPEAGQCSFKVNYKTALEIAVEHGVKLKKGKFSTDLIWIAPPMDSLNGKPDWTKVYLGKYEFTVSVFKRKERFSDPRIKRIMGIYDVIHIDACTGRFLKRAEMKRTLSWYHPARGSGGIVR
ncbi:MAG: hypothetical protein JKY52_18820 [Flavobacteriales bacterium]|nr:hypothetical protein [Flavobacteriales bacterium]